LVVIRQSVGRGRRKRKKEEEEARTRDKRRKRKRGKRRSGKEEETEEEAGTSKTAANSALQPWHRCSGLRGTGSRDAYAAPPGPSLGWGSYMAGSKRWFFKGRGLGRRSGPAALFRLA
jgi:hypothetical protein